MTEEMVTIPLEMLRHLYDLAVDSPTVCSGSFETDDVVVLRETAERIDVDPLTATPDEFRKDFPHPFVPIDLNVERENVPIPPGEHPLGFSGRFRRETDDEVRARVAHRAELCAVGSYFRGCRRPESDPMHVAPWEPKS